MFTFHWCDAFLVAAAWLHGATSAVPLGDHSGRQIPLEGHKITPHQTPRRLHGRFLHLTDLHPDQFYKVHASTEEDHACHRGKGSAGYFGAETSDCDAPLSLIDATFQWINDHLRDEIDFVVWTGDSARHDSDEKIPRNQKQVLETNRYVVDKLVEVFGSDNDDDPTNNLIIPIISTFGNNDILPHNILQSGPNKWLKEYTDVWKRFIPEEQRHGFERGGWYYVEAIPNKLAVFSLNTLYFFNNNAAVDGCALRSEPGYEHMEWLRIQLEFMRQRGMKAILTGHVPPARTGSKQLWDESCWQKYTLWLERYRDVVVGGLYGHMNIDHFMLHDTKDINILALEKLQPADYFTRESLDDELTIASATDYLEELREHWSSIPNPKLASEALDIEDVNADSIEDIEMKKKKDKKSRRDKARQELGGRWAERFQVTNVGPSVVPNYFPTLRVIDYNVTGLDLSNIWSAGQRFPDPADWLEDDHLSQDIQSSQFETGIRSEKSGFHGDVSRSEIVGEFEESKGKGGKKGKKPKKPKKPDFIVPEPPSKLSPAGPAYSPQTLTMLGYTQYFANLTHINNDYVRSDTAENRDELDTESWHGGKHKGKQPNDNVPKPKPFEYEIEYNTFDDPIYKLKDMTVKSYIKLAHRIGKYKPGKSDQLKEDDDLDEFNLGGQDDSDVEDYEVNNVQKTDKAKQNKEPKDTNNKVWLYFIKRAFVGTIEDQDLRKWQYSPVSVGNLEEAHDSEL